MRTSASAGRIGPALVLLAAVAGLGGCARDPNLSTFAVPAAAAAEIRMRCVPGSFIGTMTVNCPQPATRGAAPGRPRSEGGPDGG